MIPMKLREERMESIDRKACALLDFCASEASEARTCKLLEAKYISEI